MDQWKLVTEEVSDNTWNREGTIQGVYTIKKTKIGPNESNMYMLKNKDGNVSVWGSAVLDSRFEQIPVGSEVRITSNGKQTSEKTGRTYYDYKVEFRTVPFAEAGPDSKPSSELRSAPESSPPVVNREPGDIDLDEIPF